MSVLNKSAVKEKVKMKDIFRQDVVNRYTQLTTKFVVLEECIIKDILETEQVLGMVEYKHEKDSSSLASMLPDHIPSVSIHMNPCTTEIENRSFVEVWVSDTQITYGISNGFKYALDGETMFACSELHGYSTTLEKASEAKYDDLFSMIVSHQYPYLYRMWNFVYDINQEKPNQLERYKSFCLGRANSFFRNYLKDDYSKFPAATGIGSISGDISIYFISSALPRYAHIENPRQMPAYKYPKQYGPKSPSFARATYYDRGSDKCSVYVSGTASILGHETVFEGDIVKQCDTTFANIEYLISSENLANYGMDYDFKLSDLKAVKVYIRHLKDFDYIKERCTEVFGTDDIIYLQADVCRSDLLLEIEGFVEA